MSKDVTRQDETAVDLPYRQPEQVDANYYSNIQVPGPAQVHLGNVYIQEAPKQSELEATIATISTRLAFADMHDRYMHIDEGHEGTFEWALRGKGDDEIAWDPYHAWVTTEESPIYWVSGLPGSGKSTLMKYLVMNGATDELHRSDHVELSFWFWEAGSPLQRSLEGCLRSLLWQVLQSKSRSALGIHLRSLKNANSWSKSALMKVATDSLFTLGELKTKIFVFLDGLDESGGDARAILKFVVDLANKVAGIKICVSSRPEQIFDQTLSKYPHLRLQDLNEADIDKVIDDEFFSEIEVIELLAQQPDMEESLRDALHEGAQGVFLWVRLAIQDLLQGIMNLDDPQKLYERLHTLPQGLDGMYTAMLARNSHDIKNYRQIAGLYFQLVSHDRWSLLHFCVASDERYRARLLDIANCTTTYAIEGIQWQKYPTWIKARSAGLLRLVPHDITDDQRAIVSNRLKPLKENFCKAVDFIHRTARTFVHETAEGRKILESAATNELDIRNICQETKFLAMTVLASLNDEGPVGRHREWGLHVCQHMCMKYPSTTFVEKVRATFSSMNQRKTLLVDHFFLPREYEFAPMEPFPCFEDGTFDFTRTCCRLSWHNFAAKEMTQVSCPQKQSWLPLVVFEAICGVALSFMSLTGSQPKCQDFLHLVHVATELGADFTALLPLRCNGKLSLNSTYSLTLIEQTRFYTTSSKLERQYIALQDTIQPHADRQIMSTLSQLSHFLLSVWVNYHLERACFLWGNYNPSELHAIARPPLSNHLVDLETGNKSRIYVMAGPDVHDGEVIDFASSARPSRMALYSISRTDSDVLMSLALRLRSEGALSSCYMIRYGAISLCRGDQLSIAACDLIRRICARSRRLANIHEALEVMSIDDEEIEAYIGSKSVILDKLRLDPDNPYERMDLSLLRRDSDVFGFKRRR